MSVFDPETVWALLKSLQGSLSDQKKFVKKYKEKVSLEARAVNRRTTYLVLVIQIEQTLARWKGVRNAETDLPEQLVWAANVVAYVDYVYSSTTVKANAKKDPPQLKQEVPLLGPLFLPPTYVHLQKSKSAHAISPKTMYLKPLHIIHPFYYPNLAQCPQCDSLNVSWQGWTATGHRDVHGVEREETALGYQLECNSCKESRAEKRIGGRKTNSEELVCMATTNPKFWARKHDCEVPSE